MVSATSDALLESVYRIRYQVYCLETGFEDPAQFPDGMEKDEYDIQSEHYLIRHRETNAFAATTRLILPHPQDLGRPFPTECHCHIERLDLLDNIPRNQIAEVSRLCVSGEFKRRKGEPHTTAGIGRNSSLRTSGRDNNRRVLPNFTLALFSCAVRMSSRHGITHWYALMEYQVARLFRTLGIHFIPIGPMVEYHGQRRPYLIKIADLLAETKIKNPDAWEMLSNSGNFWDDSDRDTVANWLEDADKLKFLPASRYR